MKAGELIGQLRNEHPDWTYQQIADEVRRRIPGARTSRRSVASTLSRSAGQSAVDPATEDRSGIGMSRYRREPIGNPQNGVVRNLLGAIGEHGFTRKDWERVRSSTFGDRCGYCGKAGDPQKTNLGLTIDHAIPISLEKLGEHHLGNLVPACADCNRAKGDKDYAEFMAARPELAAHPERKQIIDAHMAEQRYEPLRRDGVVVRTLLQAAQAEVRALADRYGRLLSEMNAKVERENRSE